MVEVPCPCTHQPGCDPHSHKRLSVKAPWECFAHEHAANHAKTGDVVSCQCQHCPCREMAVVGDDPTERALCPQCAKRHA